MGMGTDSHLRVIALSIKLETDFSTRWKFAAWETECKLLNFRFEFMNCEKETSKKYAYYTYDLYGSWSTFISSWSQMTPVSFPYKTTIQEYYRRSNESKTQIIKPYTDHTHTQIQTQIVIAYTQRRYVSWGWCVFDAQDNYTGKESTYDEQ